MTKQERLTMVKAMHEIITSMNNEDAYFTWIYLMPDEPSEDDFEWFAEDTENFDELVNAFVGLCKHYIADGLFIGKKLYTGHGGE